MSSIKQHTEILSKTLKEEKKKKDPRKPQKERGTHKEKKRSGMEEGKTNINK
jgi:hypothetical protein